MRKCTIFTLIILLFFVCQINAQNSERSKEGRKLQGNVGIDPITGNEIVYPEIPRVSVWEAYNIYKTGKAIIFHSGGEVFSKRHILGAFNLDVPDNKKEEILPKFPKKGIEILTYCYWAGETASASLAHFMIKREFENVRVVRGGGKEMEKYFEYYISTNFRTEIRNPITGKVIVLKK